MKAKACEVPFFIVLLKGGETKKSIQWGSILKQLQSVLLTLAVRSSKSSRLLECKRYFQNTVLPRGRGLKGESMDMIVGICSKCLLYFTDIFLCVPVTMYNVCMLMGRGSSTYSLRIYSNLKRSLWFWFFILWLWQMPHPLCMHWNLISRTLTDMKALPSWMNMTLKGWGELF